MHITPYGAAGEVTGSSYLVTTEHAKVLVDFGMFQGDAEDDAKNIVPIGLHAPDISAIVLTHGHLDHCGRLPMLVRRGFRGAIHCTAATRDMAELILLDAAHIMESDYERKKRKAQKKGIKLNRQDEPLYTTEDVHATVTAMREAPFEEFIEVAPGVSIRLHEAGHMLGSTSVEMLATEGERTMSIVFSGDLGPQHLPFLKDPVTPPKADVVIMESTYGDRDHKPLRETVDEFAEIIRNAIADRGKIFVPSFAIGRAQQVLYHLAELIRNSTIPAIPIFLDSPMAIEASHIYAKHPELFDEESAALASSGQLLQDLRTVRPLATADESKGVNEAHGPFIVIAGSGMCTAGRILHHLRQNLADPKAHVVIVGFQAHGTLGRRLVNGDREVYVLGDMIPVRARIHTLGGFSAHAGQTELLDWFAPLAGPKPQVFLTHGEDDARMVLASKMDERFGITPYLPTYREHLTI